MNDFRDGEAFGPVSREQERSALRALVAELPVRELLRAVELDLIVIRSAVRRALSVLWSARPVPVLVGAGEARMRRETAARPRTGASVALVSSAPTRGPSGPVWAPYREGRSGVT